MGTVCAWHICAPDSHCCHDESAKPNDSGQHTFSISQFWSSEVLITRCHKQGCISSGVSTGDVSLFQSLPDSILGSWHLPPSSQPTRQQFISFVPFSFLPVWLYILVFSLICTIVTILDPDVYSRIIFSSQNHQCNHICKVIFLPRD